MTQVEQLPVAAAAAACEPRVVETHSAVLLLLGPRVYKVKKPVDLGFLDFTTLEARRAVCSREVELNRRLSPDVYLGVHDLCDERGEVVEHLVVMRRMPDDRALSALVRRGADVRDDLRRVARLVAGFHATARRSPEIDEAGSADHLRTLWASGCSLLERFVGDAVDATTLDRVRRLHARYLDGRGALLAERRAAGCIRDGHGDLLAADVFCLPDGPRVLDCIEFDDALRHGDVLLDVAFLAMDLEDLGRPDLAARFLCDYDEFSGHPGSRSLTDHYVAYRALVRSKVACLRWAQGDDAAVHAARRLADLCLRHLEASAVRLVLVGGLPGTGKSTLAAALADRYGWTVLRSDALRKELAGRGWGERGHDAFGEGLYDAGSTGRTYRLLLERARTALERGESVVLDASWSDERWRAAARALAADTSSDVVELRCCAPAPVAAARTAERAAAGTDPSDADADVARRMAAAFDAWPTAAVVDTDRPPADVVALAAVTVTART